MDLFVANIDEEIFSLYHNNGDGTFDDVAMPQGIGMATRWMSGWGLKFFDYDNDGNVDLILANGFPDDLDRSDIITVKLHIASRFCSSITTGKTFKDVSAESGPVFVQEFRCARACGWRLQQRWRGRRADQQSMTGRRCCSEQCGKSNHWLGLHLVGRKSQSGRNGCAGYISGWRSEAHSG